MGEAGQTTVIRRVLQHRAHANPPDEADTTATVQIMLRVLPPTRTLVTVEGTVLNAELTRRLSAEYLELEIDDDGEEALRRSDPFYPLVITDSLDLIRRARTLAMERIPVFVYVSELDEASEREAGVLAGADECIGRRAGEHEWRARISAARRIAELETVLRITLVENRKLATVDELTGVASRRFFTKHFPREVDRAARYGHALSLVLCDIDHFKHINDTAGHPGGDEVLRHFGMRLQETLRRGVDWVARIGGEEFAIVLPETGFAQGAIAARRLCDSIGGQRFSVQGKPLQVTASFGVCGLDRVPGGADKIAERLLKAADAALYRSKGTGRNRVTATKLAVPPPP